MTPTSPAGAREALVTIEGLTESVGDSGYPIESFAPLGPAVWMERISGTSLRAGDEIFTANQFVPKVVTTWVMPYRPDMDPDAVNVLKERRLVFLGRTHDIVEATLIGHGNRDQIRLITRQQEHG